MWIVRFFLMTARWMMNHVIERAYDVFPELEMNVYVVNETIAESAGKVTKVTGVN